MTLLTALASFFVAAGLLTITPGLDTVLVIRTRLATGVRAGVAAAGGVATGCLVWGFGVTLGLGALLRIAPLAYDALRLCGAAYLAVMGLLLLCRPRHTLAIDPAAPRPDTSRQAFAKGALTNLLNPKVGLFYLSFLPQFVPASLPAAPVMAGLTLLHAAMCFAWLSALSAFLGIAGPFLRRPRVIRWLDRASGGVFVAFGLKLALSRA